MPKEGKPKQLKYFFKQALKLQISKKVFRSFHLPADVFKKPVAGAAAV